MHIEYRRLVKADAGLLAEFLTSQPWPFFSGGQADPAKIRRKVRRGFYNSDEMRTFWMVVDGTEAGLIQFEFQGEMPGTDLRIRSAYRGRGLGTLALRWLTDYVFNELPELRRLECPTREDNHAMRRAFVTCGFTLEAQFREAWPTAEGTFKDTMVYGILRREWASDARAPVAPTTSV